jgi:hypothetical protein
MLCCHGLHDVQARLDVPGQVRFVTVCVGCGREQRELSREPYTPRPLLPPHIGQPAPSQGAPADGRDPLGTAPSWRAAASPAA